MELKGKVSTIESGGVRVTFENYESTVSAPIDVATHVGELMVGDMVAVIFFSDNMKDGLVIAKY
ncbi:MAG: hypothetical protein ACM3TR_11475 [Caulobacteraceae bacterium]